MSVLSLCYIIYIGVWENTCILYPGTHSLFSLSVWGKVLFIIYCSIQRVRRDATFAALTGIDYYHRSRVNFMRQPNQLNAPAGLLRLSFISRWRYIYAHLKGMFISIASESHSLRAFKCNVCAMLKASNARWMSQKLFRGKINKNIAEVNFAYYYCMKLDKKKNRA